MMMTPLISVIIPNYNYSKYLREAIESVLEQTYPNIEVIVVDDGSKDNSKEILESYEGKIKTVFQKNQGVSAARNNGAAISSGEFLAFLDADDVWFPTKIEKQVQKFLSDEGLGLVHVGVEEINADGKGIRTLLNGLEGNVSHEFLLFERAVILGGGSGFMVSRKVFEEVGGFDPRLSTSADWDIFYRVSSRYRVGFVPEILLKYRVHNSNMHANIPRMEHDMMLGFEKAFAAGASVNRRECYGNLHRTLAGSYFHANQYLEFLRHTVKSIWNKPSNLAYFAQFPLRRLRKK
jgi:Glycosyltransferases, probably involved in cell wall biogenesis